MVGPDPVIGCFSDLLNNVIHNRIKSPADLRPSKVIQGINRGNGTSLLCGFRIETRWPISNSQHGALEVV